MERPKFKPRAVAKLAVPILFPLAWSKVSLAVRESISACLMEILFARAYSTQCRRSHLSWAARFETEMSADRMKVIIWVVLMKQFYGRPCWLLVLGRSVRNIAKI